MDSECSSTGSSSNRDSNPRGSIFVKIGESEKDFQLIKDQFITGMGALGKHTQLHNVYRKAYTTPQDKAKLQQFMIFKQSLKTKRRGNPNETYAWYGASEEQIYHILSNGFANPADSGTHGRGICLYPATLPLKCLESSVPDTNGIQHLLLCRVLLGNSEVVVQLDPTQCCPSSEEFDSGVNSLVSPTKYIIRNKSINNQILPEFLISFKVFSTTTRRAKIPAHISALFLELSLMLPHSKGLIAKYEKEAEAGKLTSKELKWRLRDIAGDYLLVQAIRSCKKKQKKALLTARGI